MEIKVASFEEAIKRLEEVLKKLGDKENFDVSQLQITSIPPMVFHFLVQDKRSRRKWDCFVSQTGEVNIRENLKNSGKK